MTLRIQWQKLTVKALQVRLQRAYRGGDVRLVRRINVLLELGQAQVGVAELAQKWGLSVDCIYKWLQAFIVERLDSLTYGAAPGRACKLTPGQKQRLCHCASSWMLAPRPQVLQVRVGCVLEQCAGGRVDSTGVQCLV